MGGVKFFLSWSTDSSASLEGLRFVAVMVRFDCIPTNEAGVGDWVQTRQEIVGRNS